jgi:tetratricopeptide (TPR) repeat protein
VSPFRRWASLALVLLSVAAEPLPAQRARLLVPLDELEARAARDSLDPMAHYNVALGYWTKGRWNDVERSLRRSVAIEPKMAPAYLGLALLPFARRPMLWKEEESDRVPADRAPQLEESYRFFRRAFQLDPLVDLKLFGLAVPPRGAIVVGRNATPAYAALVQGFESLWDGQYATAFGWLDGVLHKLDRGKPDDVPEGLLWYHGLAAAHLEKYDLALLDFQRLYDRAAAREQSDTLVRTFIMESNQIRYVLATVSRRAGRADQALALYRESAATDLGLYMAHVQMADIYEDRQLWNDAITERQRALEVNPDDASLRYDLAYSLARARQFNDAAETLTELMQTRPLNPRIPYLLGLVQLRLGDGRSARDALQLFVTIAPSRFNEQVAEARQQLNQLEQ